MTLANVPEYVSSLGFNLELCKAACSKQGESASLRLVDVHGKFEAEFQIVKVKASEDLAMLRSKVQKMHTQSGGDDEELRSHLQIRLSRMQTESAIPSSSSTPNESKLQSTTRNATAVSRSTVRNAKTQKPKVIMRSSSCEVREVKWLGMTVAEKVFNSAEHEGFKKEVQISQRLCHPNVTPLFSSTTKKSMCSIFMELMGLDLYQLIQKLKEVDSILQPTQSCTPFTLMEAVDLMLQVGQGVEYLHDQEPIIVHLDLKSSNVLIRSFPPREESERGIEAEDFKIGEDFRRYFQVKLTDFGLSEMKANSNCSSDQRYNVGTSRWMPPETVKSKVGGEEKMGKKAPKKSDVYSFAMVFYEVLTGNLPFHDVSAAEAKQKAKLRDRPVLPEHCSPRLKLLIEQCWSHEPRDRPHFDFICKELRYLKYLLMTGTTHIAFIFISSNIASLLVMFVFDCSYDWDLHKKMTLSFTRVLSRSRVSK
jgi:serine/threonine protein kinase